MPTLSAQLGQCCLWSSTVGWGDDACACDRPAPPDHHCAQSKQKCERDCSIDADGSHAAWCDNEPTPFPTPAPSPPPTPYPTPKPTLSPNIQGTCCYWSSSDKDPCAFCEAVGNSTDHCSHGLTACETDCGAKWCDAR